MGIEYRVPNKLGKLGTKAKDEAIAIMRWAKSCKTKEQFENIERFAIHRSWEINRVEISDVEYYMGVCSGFILGLRKIKFA